MINIFDVCLTDLITKKNLLEGELERIINDPTMNTEHKFSTTLELLEKISKVYSSIDLIKNYITKNEKETN